jgi:hypothetical protein
MFTANEDLSTYGTIEHFQNAASHWMTFRKCIVEMSKIFLNVMNGNNDDPVRGIVTLQQPRMPMHVPNTSSIWKKMEDVLLARKETGRSPKKNVLKRQAGGSLKWMPTSVLHQNDLRPVSDILFCVSVK